MQEVVKTIQRLQHLELIKEEYKIIHFGSAQNIIQELENNYDKLLQSLPDIWKNRYFALRKNGYAVAKEAGGMCQGCKMSINLKLLQRMRNGEADLICPNCGKFLLLHDVSASNKK